ncbi:MAG: hypothetical protein LBC42_01985 [Puniceicoccales bacterium]|jgi:hypothetical protein|nr:hypothetical protein [Puniceicoccales bacterium]
MVPFSILFRMRTAVDDIQRANFETFLRGTRNALAPDDGTVLEVAPNPPQPDLEVILAQSFSLPPNQRLPLVVSPPDEVDFAVHRPGQLQNSGTLSYETLELPKATLELAPQSVVSVESHGGGCVDVDTANLYMVLAGTGPMPLRDLRKFLSRAGVEEVECGTAESNSCLYVALARQIFPDRCPGGADASYVWPHMEVRCMVGQYSLNLVDNVLNELLAIIHDDEALREEIAVLQRTFDPLRASMERMSRLPVDMRNRAMLEDLQAKVQCGSLSVDEVERAIAERLSSICVKIRQTIPGETLMKRAQYILANDAQISSSHYNVFEDIAALRMLVAAHENPLDPSALAELQETFAADFPDLDRMEILYNAIAAERSLLCAQFVALLVSLGVTLKKCKDRVKISRQSDSLAPLCTQREYVALEGAQDDPFFWRDICAELSSLYSSPDQKSKFPFDGAEQAPMLCLLLHHVAQVVLFVGYNGEIIFPQLLACAWKKPIAVVTAHRWATLKVLQPDGIATSYALSGEKDDPAISALREIAENGAVLANFVDGVQQSGIHWRAILPVGRRRQQLPQPLEDVLRDRRQIWCPADVHAQQLVVDEQVFSASPLPHATNLATPLRAAPVFSQTIRSLEDLHGMGFTSSLCPRNNPLIVQAGLNAEVIGNFINYVALCIDHLCNAATITRHSEIIAKFAQLAVYMQDVIPQFATMHFEDIDFAALQAERARLHANVEEVLAVLGQQQQGANTDSRLLDAQNALAEFEKDIAFRVMQRERFRSYFVALTVLATAAMKDLSSDWFEFTAPEIDVDLLCIIGDGLLTLPFPYELKAEHSPFIARLANLVALLSSGSFDMPICDMNFQIMAFSLKKDVIVVRGGSQKPTTIFKSNGMREDVPNDLYRADILTQAVNEGNPAFMVIEDNQRQLSRLYSVSRECHAV